MILDLKRIIYQSVSVYWKYENQESIFYIDIYTNPMYFV